MQRPLSSLGVVVSDFFRNDFTFSGSGNRGWLLVFGSMSDVAFHRNRFFESDMDLISHPQIERLAHPENCLGRNHSAYLLKDESFFRAMIRRTHELPESARLTTVDSHYSTPHVGLWRVTLVANTGIRRVLMRCSAKHYAFRGRNEIQSLHFDEPRTDMKDTVVYLGSRERDRSGSSFSASPSRVVALSERLGGCQGRRGPCE